MTLRLRSLPVESPWRDWIENNFISTLFRAQEVVRAAEVKVRAESSLLVSDGWEGQRREGWQARAYDVLAKANQSHALKAHLRKKLDRWRVDILPGRRVARATKALETLSRSAPPKIFAVVLRTICDGWTTSRRFQGRGRCCLGCAQEDSLVHYSTCRIFHRLCRRVFGLSEPPVERRLADFLCLDPYTDGLPAALRGGDAPTAARTLRGLAVYCLHRTLNAVRHGQVHGALMAEQAFTAFAAEAAGGHRRSVLILSRAKLR